MVRQGFNIEQVYLCTEFVDFRKRAPGLSILVEAVLQKDPFAPFLYM